MALTAWSSIFGLALLAQASTATPVPPDASAIRNFLRVTPDVCTGGQPRPEQFAALKTQGVKAVLNLRTPGEYAVDEELRAVKEAGLLYFNIPVVYQTPTEAQADEFLAITDNPANRPLFIHCTAAIRVGAFWLIRRVVRDDWTWDAALAEARKVGLTNAPHLETFARHIIAKYKPTALTPGAGPGGAVRPADGASRTPAPSTNTRAGAQPTDGIREWTGKVSTGVMAIGGETTGIILDTGQDRVELAGDQATVARLQALNGQRVTIRGRLEIRQGVEVRTRRIVQITAIVEPK